MEIKNSKSEQFSEVRKKPRWPGDRNCKDPDVPRENTNPKEEQDKLPPKKKK